MHTFCQLPLKTYLVLNIYQKIIIFCYEVVDENSKKVLILQ